MTESYQVFISWSGDRSREIGLIWKSLIEDTFDSVNAFVSHRDITPGERGLTVIKARLDETSVGIPIVTADNVDSQWINFESGALSKEVPDAPVRVMPCLVDYKDPSELTGPLTQFQAKLLNQDGVEAILSTIAQANSIEWQRKKAGFEARWPQFDEQFAKYREPSKDEKASGERSQKDMLAEIVNNTRELRKTLSNRRFSPLIGENVDALSRAVSTRLDMVRGEVQDYSIAQRGRFRANVVVDSDSQIFILVEQWGKSSRQFLEQLSVEYGVRVGEFAPLGLTTHPARRVAPSTERDVEIVKARLSPNSG
ncbi:toll/interleukin-1 receptor domain-containing protein [Mycobacteroides abscessus]|uniref:toll/interleukin-1 receptor domain-containing protein n=1 Tax=Mycobacteroides abscessus TaxID=36809 RepID=UPI000C268ABB|nr:toll/interleukin-1 receptor domain-containing protein [Mycobacteroides abscessus]